MNTEELNKKIERLRLLTEAKLEYIREHSKLIDQAFEELKEVTESELDIVHERISDIDKRLFKNGI